MRYTNRRILYFPLLYDRQTTDGTAIAYSEREHEFTFAKNVFIIKTTAPIPIKFCKGIKTTKYTSWVVQARAKQIQDGGRRLFWKIEKSPYLSDGWPVGTKLAQWRILALLTVTGVKISNF